MSTEDKKYFLSVGDVMALHFAKAADGSKAVKLAPITKASFGNEDTALITFTTAAEADVYKDNLCASTAAAVNRKIVKEHVLEDYCTMEIQHMDRRLEIA